jgi:hypothetical protein
MYTNRSVNVRVGPSGGLVLHAQQEEYDGYSVTSGKASTHPRRHHCLSAAP